MNPERSLNGHEEISSLQKTAGFLPSILFSFFPYNFLTLLNEITFLLSSPHPSNPSPLKLSDAVGPGEEGTLEARRGEGLSLGGGKQHPSCLLGVTTDNFPNGALSHFPTEIASSPPYSLPLPGLVFPIQD